jgi:polysaccharide export outer membrane protein
VRYNNECPNCGCCIEKTNYKSSISIKKIMSNLNNTSRLCGTIVAIAVAGLALAGCASSPELSSTGGERANEPRSGEYIIGPGDSLQVFVWGHEDLTTTVQVRPDGQISTPLVEDMIAAGKSPTALARDVETVLEGFVRSPTVTVIVQSFVGEYDRQVRVVGQAAEPQALPYRSGMTLLDVMIEVGGLSEFASGNRAKVVRNNGGEEAEIKVRIDDLLNEGDMSQNIKIMPGDILVIPESIF